MSVPDRQDAGLRVLILAPTGKDAVLAQAILEKAGIASVICRDIHCVGEEAKTGVGCVLIAEEALDATTREGLTRLLAEQPAWSDLPQLVLTRQRVDSVSVISGLTDLGNVALLERPVRVGALVSAVRVALRARARQYQIRSHMAEQQRAEDALRDADRRKDEFLATLAHELRNPLAPIRNALQILRLAGTSQAVVERVRGMMDRQVDHMVRLVDDLMEVSRITRGKIELRKQRVDLATVVRNAVESCQPLIDNAGHQLELELPNEPLVLDADPVRLAQVFGNLLNNAAKYTREAGRIWLCVARENGSAVVCVRDTGMGIAPEMLPRVFDMFTQIDSTQRHSQGGLGIGLTLVRSLVGMHGGTVSVHSDGPGEGSEFRVRLPLAAVEEGRDPTPAQAAAAHRPPQALRVLVVDDNRDAADSLGLVLRLSGAQVHVVHDGAAALEALPHFRPALVLLDLGMPEMDGYEVARRIREELLQRDVSLVALTGWGQAEDRHRVREAGFDHHLVKPTDFESLQAVLASVGHRDDLQQAQSSCG